MARGTLELRETRREALTAIALGKAIGMILQKRIDINYIIQQHTQHSINCAI